MPPRRLLSSSSKGLLTSSVMIASTSLAAWYLHDPCAAKSAVLEKVAIIKSLSPLSFEPNKMRKIDVATRKAVVDQLRKEEWQKTRSGSLQENSPRRRVLVTFGKMGKEEAVKGQHAKPVVQNAESEEEGRIGEVKKEELGLGQIGEVKPREEMGGVEKEGAARADVGNKSGKGGGGEKT